jgi:hypothetical protein
VLLPQLFQPVTGNMGKIAKGVAAVGKETAVYEVNLHTREGDAGPVIRKQVVAGMAAGTALAANMLGSLAQGVRRQCVYTLAGFDTDLPGGGFTPLFGIVRDLGATQRLRPAGFALLLMNKVLKGDMVRVEQSGPADVFVYAFLSDRRFSFVALSASPVRRVVNIRVPRSRMAEGLTDQTTRLLRLAAPSASSTNEDSEDVRIMEESVTPSGDMLSFALEPWSMAVIAGNEPASR